MRIGFISTYPPIECGIATYTSYLNEALKKSGNETFVVSPLGAHGEGVFPIYRPESTSMPTQIFDISAEFTPDIIHIQHEYGLYGPQRGVHVIGLIVMYKLAGIPVVTTLHTVQEKPDHAENTLLRLIISESSAVIVHEQFLKDTLVKRFGQEEKIHVIYHGIREVEVIKDAKKKLEIEGKKVILLCGYFRPTKGFKKIVKLMPEICKQADDIVLLVAGKSRGLEFQEYQKEFYEAINNSPVNDKIMVLRGQFPQHTFDAIVSASDIVVLPYVKGAQSGIMAQCFAFNKPAITSNLLAFRKLVKRSNGGWICKSNKEYVQSIIKILRDDDLYRTLQNNIKEYVKNYSSWTVTAQQHIKVYQSVVRIPYGNAKYVYWEEGK
ncbi:glycosyltransferase [Thermodesulfobacteriota bacterium]